MLKHTAGTSVRKPQRSENVLLSCLNSGPSGGSSFVRIANLHYAHGLVKTESEGIEATVRRGAPTEEGDVWIHGREEGLLFGTGEGLDGLRRARPEGVWHQVRRMTRDST